MPRDGKRFIMAPTWLPRVPKLVKPTHIKVLLCLLHHRGANDTCHVSGPTIGREAKVSIDVVFQALGIWEDLGVIKRNKRFSNSNVYEFDDHLLYHGEPNFGLLPTLQAMRKAHAQQNDLHRKKADGVACLHPGKRDGFHPRNHDAKEKYMYAGKDGISDRTDWCATSPDVSALGEDEVAYFDDAAGEPEVFEDVAWEECQPTAFSGGARTRPGGAKSPEGAFQA